MGRYFRLEDTAYVSSILTLNARGNRKIRLVDDSQIEDMRHSLREEASRDIDEGDCVCIQEGTYASMEGVVDELDGDQAKVVIKEMRSRQPTVDLPVVFLEKA
jgi:transcription antitermination factor NusG